MNQNVKFEDILNICLERILKGETVEACLLSYPDQASQLEPLLRTAQAAHIASTIQPRAEFKARARYEFQSALREMEEKKSRRRSWFNWHWQWRWQSGWAIALIVVMVVVAGGGGTVVAASNSMPDEALYSVKLTTEKVQLAITTAEITKAELNAKFADRRTDEIIYLATKDDAQEVQNVAELLNSNLENLTQITGANIEMDAQTANSEPQPLLAAESTAGGGDSGPQMGVAAVPPEESNTVMAVPKTTIAAVTPNDSGAGVMAPRATTPPAATETPETTVADTGEAPEQVPMAVAKSAAAPAITSPPQTPAPMVTVNSSLQVEKGLSGGNTGSASDPELARIETLRSIIIANFENRQARLEEALENASPSVRPAIRQAIAQSEAEFEKALRNLEIAENIEK